MKWIKGITICLVVVFLSGCFGGNKEEDVCKDIIQRVVSDPRSIQYNEVSRIEGETDFEYIRSIYQSRPGGEISPAKKRYLELVESDGSGSKMIFISIDYTHDARFGKARDKAICQFWEHSKKMELVSLSVAGRGFEQPDFMNLFLNIGRPEGLSSLNQVE